MSDDPICECGHPYSMHYDGPCRFGEDAVSGASTAIAVKVCPSGCKKFTEIKPKPKKDSK